MTQQDSGRKTLLLTRPLAESQALAERLENSGHACLLAPMLDILPLPYSLPAVTPAADAILITSPRAVAALKDRILNGNFLTLPVLAVGAKSAEMAKKIGFRQIVSGTGGLESLVETIKNMQLWKDNRPKRVLHLCGQDLRVAPEPLFETEGVRVERIPVYTAKRTDGLPSAVAAALREGRITDALFFSPRTAENFSRLVQEYKLSEELRHVRAHGLSTAVADALAGLIWASVHVVERPSEDLLIAPFIAAKN